MISTILTSAALGDQVYLRDSSNSIQCTLISWSKEGLRIQENDGSQQRVLPWHKVKSLHSEQIGETLAEHLARGEMLWRAKIRLDRGDIVLASPIFEEAFMQLKNARGDDAFLAAEGLLRCNIAFGKVDESVAPWIASVKHVQDGRASLFPSLSPVIDDKTFLCPHLPPIWDPRVVKRSLSKLVMNDELTKSFSDVILGRANLKQSLQIGPRFLQQVLLLLEHRQPSSTKLSENIPSDPELRPWQKAWVKYATAIGLLSQGKESRNRALLKLAEVISIDGGEHPLLSVIAMVTLAQSLEEDGNTKAAGNVLAELERIYPAHRLLKNIRSGNMTKGRKHDD